MLDATSSLMDMGKEFIYFWIPSHLGMNGATDFDPNVTKYVFPNRIVGNSQRKINSIYSWYIFFYYGYAVRNWCRI